MVRVKSKQEIEKTLTKSKNLGLWFDVEMHRYCGGEFRVARRVQTIIREDNGSLLTLKNPCIVLEGVVGTGEYLGVCPQSDLLYWREVWLERSSKASDTVSHARLAPTSVKDIPSVQGASASPGLNDAKFVGAQTIPISLPFYSPHGYIGEHRLLQVPQEFVVPSNIFS
jgi:hypothetical protein